MSSRSFNLVSASALAAALILSACGGGGAADDGGSAGPPTVITVTAQPADQSVTAAGVARFSLSATGTGLSYQWQTSTDGGTTWVNVAGATAAALELTGVTTAQNGHQYRALITGTGGSSAITSVVTLQVAAAVVAPSITSQPQSVSLTEGQGTTLSVTATGTNVSYRWQSSTDGSSWADVAGGSGASLVLDALPVSADGRAYRVLVSNSAATLTSTAATLRVQAADAAPAISSQPLAVSVVAPAAAAFNVSVTGTPAPSLQWQQSSNGGTSYTDIAGATGTTYTTAATSVGANGTRYRVVATNSAGSTVSNAATLSVSAATAAPTLSAQPASGSWVVGQTATFSATASGTPTPTYRWQLSTDSGTTWANINGATSASYTTAILGLTDSGKRYRVVVSNSAGSATSNAAVLTVNAVASVLSGRAWATGQALETNDNDVLNYDGAIDDAGRTTILFTKSDGSRTVLYAVQGVPNAAGVTPAFSVPTAIDAAAPISGSSNFKIAVSPVGNAAATWLSVARCNNTTYVTSSSNNCNYRYAARRMAGATTWEAPQLVASSNSSTLGSFSINDRGDLLVEVQGWVRSGTSSFTTQDATVTWKANADSAFRQHFITGTNLTNWSQHLDKLGNITVVAQASQNATTDIVAYRGTVSAGMGNQELLDQRGAAATLIGSWVGINGQIVALWNQNNGTATTGYAATADTPSGAWALNDIGQTIATDPYFASVTDSGDFVLYKNRFRLQRKAGVWGAFEGFVPWGSFWSSTRAGTRDGSMLVLDGNNLGSNTWATFDAVADALIQPFTTAATGPGHILGVTSTMPGIALLAKNGTAAFISVNNFDVLPTPAVPAGDKRTVDNLWGFYLK